jgi:polysaccharide export outer membrane protein
MRGLFRAAFAATVLASAESAAHTSSDYRVGIGDVVQVTFPGEGASQSCRVQTTGTVRLPEVGDVRAAGRSVAEIESAVDDLLRGAGLSAGAAVEVVDYQSQAVTVVGAVDRPGRLPLRGNTRLVELLAEAGGLTPHASGEVVIRRLDGQSLKLRLRQPAAMTLEALAAIDVPVEAGDLISVSPKRYVTVEGEVVRPGWFAIEEEPTVTWAIARAGGLTRPASRTVTVRRLGPDGVPAEIPVSVKAIERGEAPDFRLQPGDVVTVKHRIF